MSNTNPVSLSRRLALLGLGTTLATLAIAAASNQPASSTAFETKRRSSRSRRRYASPSSITEPHLREASEKTLGAVDSQLKPIADLFAAARGGVPGFCDAALGWHSTWCLVKDCTPFMKGSRNETFIRQQFEKQVLSQGDLVRSIQQCIHGFVGEIESVESEMLVAMRRDLALYGAEVSLTQIPPEQLQNAFRKAIQAGEQGTLSGTQSMAVDLAVTTIGAVIIQKIYTKVTTRLGVSGGVMGVGAATSWATMGLSLLVAIIIDSIISAIWNWWSDPRGKLIGQIHQKLDEMEYLVCGGESGLRAQFNQLAEDRAEFRKTAIAELI
jgi:hypothetical protein